MKIDPTLGDFGDLTDGYSVAMRLDAQAREATWDPESDSCYIDDVETVQTVRRARDALEAYATRVAALPPVLTEQRGMLACVGHYCALLARFWDETLSQEGYGTEALPTIEEMAGIAPGLSSVDKTRGRVPVDSKPAPEDENVSETEQGWEAFIEQAEALVARLVDLPDHVQDFADGIRERAESMIKWAGENEHVTDTMRITLEYMDADVSGWGK